VTSLSAIAKQLSREDIPWPRAGTRHRRQGWVDSTIRVFLHNEKYVGIWRYKTTQWIKVPGENRRVARRRDSSEVLEHLRPDLAIIDQDTWREVKARLAKVREHYLRNEDGTPKGRALPGKQTNYLLSGLLFCGACNAPMIIHGGDVPAYRCPDHTKRGTCANALSVPERVARTQLLAALRDNLLSQEGIAYARKRIAEKLGDLGRTRNAEVQERRDRLGRTEKRIAGLVHFIANGDDSAYVRSTLLDLEAQAAAEKAAIAEILKETAEPIRLPSPADLERLVFDLDARIAQDPLKGRELLRRVFKDGRVVLEPQPDRVYLARTEVLPLVLLAEGDLDQGRPRGFPGTAFSRARSGGKI
jgi:site-specific DNA recombinase